MTTAVDFLPDLDKIHAAVCREWRVQDRHRDDLYSAGQLAAVRAVQDFDTSKSTDLGVFVRVMIRNRIRDELRTCVGRCHPTPTPTDMEAPGHAWPGVDGGFAEIDDADAAGRVLRRLPRGARAFLWDHIVEGATLTEIAGWHGVCSRSPSLWLTKELRADLNALIADPHLDLTTRRPRVWETRHLLVSPHWQ